MKINNHRHLNNQAVADFAKVFVYNQIQQKLSPLALKQIYYVSGVLSDVLLNHNLYEQEINNMSIDIRDAINSLPDGEWDSMSKNKKQIYQAAIIKQVEVVSKSMVAFRNLLTGQLEIINNLSEQEQEKIYEVVDNREVA